MKRIFFEGDYWGPFRFFDQVFSIQGQNELKREFLEEVFNISEDQYNDPSFDSLDIICNLETYVVSNSYESEDGTIEIEYSYKHFLNEKFKIELKKIFILIDDHINFHTNSLNEIQFKIQKYQNKISKYRSFLSTNSVTCQKLYLNLLSRLNKRFNVILENNKIQSIKQINLSLFTDEKNIDKLVDNIIDVNLFDDSIDKLELKKLITYQSTDFVFVLKDFNYMLRVFIDALKEYNYWSKVSLKNNCEKYHFLSNNERLNAHSLSSIYSDFKKDKTKNHIDSIEGKIKKCFKFQ